jgi:hypothetical protein
MSNVLMNEIIYVSMNHPFILGIYKGENDYDSKMKVIQFASI